MSPDVSRFSVNSEDASETGPKGGHGRPMSVQEVIIVLQPLRQDMERNYPPSPLPHLERNNSINWGCERYRGLSNQLSTGTKSSIG